MLAPPTTRNPMKNKTGHSPIFAFVDIETTGSHFERDRITEIGIKTLSDDEVIAWECLIDLRALSHKTFKN